MFDRWFSRNKTPAPVTAPVVAGPLPSSLHPRVLANIHNPVSKAAGGRKVKDAYRWQDPDVLAQGYISDLKQASHGLVHYEIVERIEVDAFPVKADGFRYTDASFDVAWKARQFHQPDLADYLQFVREFKMIEKVDTGQIDEVWLFGFPYCGY